MPELHISSELNNREFTFGDVLRGQVEWSQFPEAPDKVEIRLFHYTSGKGTRDLSIVSRIPFSDPQTHDQRGFEVQIPGTSKTPPSLSGKLVSLLWAVELVAQTGRTEHTERLDIIVSASGIELDLYAYAADNVETKESRTKKWFAVKSSG